MLRRALLASFTTLFVTTALSVPAGADEAGDAAATDDIGRTHNHLQVINRQDGNLRHKGRIAIAEEADGVVDNTNLALAFGSCTDCRTAAAAIQVIVLEARASDVRPANAAVAVNADCLRCQTYAYAKQVMLSPFHAVTISDEARARLKVLERRVDELVASTLAFPDLSAQLNAVTAQVVAIVQGEIDQSAPSPSTELQEWDGEVA
jgi:hypothetical protein